MAKAKIDLNKTEFILYLVILFLVMVIVFLLYRNSQREYVVGKYDSNPVEGHFVEEIATLPVEKSGEILEAEKKLQVERKIEKLSDGTLVVKASIEHLELIDKDILLQDFVEEIRFGKHVELVEGSVEAKNGNLFPADSKLTVSGYGPGRQDEKATKINIAILDINFNRDSKDGVVYQAVFKPKEPVEELFFQGAELRFDKYILELEEEVIRVK